jgi:lysozyme family protein
MYWDKVCGDNLPKGIDYAVFDFSVNAGSNRSIKLLQQAVGVVDDGLIGPATLKAVNNSDLKETLEQFSAAKESFYKGIVDKNQTQVKFIKGWLARIDEVEQSASKMLA